MIVVVVVMVQNAGTWLTERLWLHVLLGLCL